MVSNSCNVQVQRPIDGVRNPFRNPFKFQKTETFKKGVYCDLWSTSWIMVPASFTVIDSNDLKTWLSSFGYQDTLFVLILEKTKQTFQRIVTCRKLDNSCEGRSPLIAYDCRSKFDLLEE